MRRVVGVTALVLAVAACGGDDATATETSTIPETAAADATTTSTAAPLTTTTGSSVDGCADVIDGSVSAAGETFTVSATVRSDDTGEEKYADAWEVRTLDGEVLGERILTHPHVNEQPFTRSLDGVEIPDDVDEVVLAAHDSVVGFCGAELTVAVER